MLWGILFKQKERKMKKLLTSMLTLALVLCCFTFVGCNLFKDKEKPATIEQTLAICDQFIADMQAINTKISAQDYVYPTTDAQSSATSVSSYARSTLGIRYLNYMDFDTQEVFNQDLGYPITAIDVLLDMSENGAISTLAYIIEEYKSQNLSLNTVYSFEDVDYEGDYSYFKLSNNNSQICCSYKNETSGDTTFIAEMIINLNSDNTWKSFEMKVVDLDSGVDIEYAYAEKSTDESRIFNRVIVGYIDGTDVSLSDFDESCQKMLYVHFHNEPTTDIQTQAVDYLESLNIESVVDGFDTTNDVEIQFNFD